MSLAKYMKTKHCLHNPLMICEICTKHQKEKECLCGCEGNNKDFIGKVWDKKCIYYIPSNKDRSKYWDRLVDIIDTHFPKGKCKERGSALVALAYIDMLLTDDSFEGNITIPINEVWELINKPHRFYKTLYDKVNKLKCDNYQYLNFDKKTKTELLDRIKLL